jgi:protein-L-isoaspartate(D-aspartate) O-methyltransferase
MILDIRKGYAFMFHFTKPIHDQNVLAAINHLPRDRFIPEEFQWLAFEDRPLPIGHQQTISQPFIVALMTELLELKATDRVLEIGTGSGYQTAVLAQLVNEVYTIEVIEALSEGAREVLSSLQLQNIHYRVADGYWGWEEYAPYEAIIVAAASEEVPPPLLEQLADGGRLVIPLGLPGEVQTLWKFTRDGRSFQSETHEAVRFVPFTRRDDEGR